MDRPQLYEIRIEGHLGSSWSSWFEGMTIRHEPSGETVLRGALPDQTAVHGVLMKIRDLGMPLVAVTRLDAPDTRRAGRQHEDQGENAA
jgi:hypothetical protein